jgi:hypothetical protein
MRLVEMLRNTAENIEEHSLDTVAELLRVAADTIDNSNVYKLKWAELAERCAKLEKENGTLLAEKNSFWNTENDH